MENPVVFRLLSGKCFGFYRICAKVSQHQQGDVCRDTVLDVITNIMRMCLLTYLLRGVVLEKLTGLQLVKKFPAFYGTRSFISVFTSVRHPPLSWASPIQSIPPHPTSWGSVIILSFHLHLVSPVVSFPQGIIRKNSAKHIVKCYKIRM
jgi:hypothetical protein